MASININLSILFLLFTTVTVTVTAVPEHEYSSLLSALRNRGYHVFANAITTTDLYYDIINGHNFTFFAPIDSVLYSLDMSMSAADYTTTMRFHVIPDHRLSFSDLKKLPYGSSSFPTLLNDHQIHVVNPLSLPLPVIVEGVYVDVPDLYNDNHVVVHGLESVIDFRSRNDTVSSSDSSSVNDNLSPVNAPSYGHRETYAPSPVVAAPVSSSQSPSSVFAGSEAVASPVPVPSYMPSPAVSPLPETKSESITQPNQLPETKSLSEIVVQSLQSPKPNSETVIQSNISPETKSESIVQSIESPEPKSETIIQSDQSDKWIKVREAKSEPVVKSLHSPKSYYKSITQPIEQHATIGSRSRFIPQAIRHVSLAMKPTEVDEFSPVDETVVGCPVADDLDDEREQMSIANIRRGDHYMRELYNPTDMTCKHE